MIRLSAIILISGLMTIPSINAQAASAIAYGNKSAEVQFDQPDEISAIIAALENCSARDKNCKLLHSCSASGFGAVYIARISGVIDSIGFACGQSTAQDADSTARISCEAHKTATSCSPHSNWLDR